MKKNHFLLLKKLKNTESAQLCWQFTTTGHYWSVSSAESERIHWPLIYWWNLMPCNFNSVLLHYRYHLLPDMGALISLALIAGYGSVNWKSWHARSESLSLAVWELDKQIKLKGWLCSKLAAGRYVVPACCP